MSPSHGETPDRAGRGTAGPWRSLAELEAAGAGAGPADGVDPAGRAAHGEEPQPATLEPLSRRGFLGVLGGSLTLAGLGACTRQPRETILPWARRPEDTLPGEPLHFATAMPFAGGALGLLVESHDGRPIKIEGNPDHPASRGATDALAQATLLELYDPDRSRAVMHRGRISSWEAFGSALAAALEPVRANEGAGLRVLSPPLTSPTLAGQRERLLARLPRTRWHVWEPVHRDRERAGAVLAFGRDVEVRADLSRARVVLCLDADPLGGGPSSVRHARAFAASRRVRDGVEPAEHRASRLYAVESHPTLTGAAADHRLALAPSRIERVVRRLAGRLGVAGGTTEPLRGEDARLEAWLDVAARDLLEHEGEALVLAGRTLSPGAHALVHAIHERLGAVGRTVELGEPVGLGESDESCAESIAALARDLRAGEVELLLVLGGNPAHDAPAELELGPAIERAKLAVRVGLHVDETSERCPWHVPEAHFLETWSDARAFDGTVSIVQPLIAPLYDGHGAHEVLALLSDEPGRSAYDIVRAHWTGVLGEEGFERRWRRALHDGLVAGTTEPALEATLRDFDPGPAPAHAGDEGALELVLHPDEAAWDGRFAGNAWLQELPRPLTRLTWDNAALVAPATAKRLGVESGDVLELALGERGTRAAAWVTPGAAEGCVALSLGCGRRLAGAVGTGAGFDAYPLRTAGTPWSAGGLRVTRTGARHAFATTQEHHSMEGRDLIRELTVERFRAGGTGAPAHSHVPAQPPSLYADDGQRNADQADNQWGMVIDLNACIGCNACAIACQAENNIPVVGKEEVARGRAMHWIRVDRYYAGVPDDPDVRFQPVPCMHCENAPCELVCPVGATVHGPEGLNEMVYNRCVGTRYCSNNCPYKVRRFNFLLYSDFETEPLKLSRNPDVTVRSRGVMEKCTYCVQRINEAHVEARKEGRPIRDGEVRTACQQVCPAQAITFGDVADEDTAVSKQRALPHHYGILEELNTRPRTTYLARLTNPHPELASPGEVGDGRHGEEEHD